MIAPPDVLGVLLDLLADRIAARIITAPDRESYSSRVPPRRAAPKASRTFDPGRTVSSVVEAMIHRADVDTRWSNAGRGRERGRIGSACTNGGGGISSFMVLVYGPYAGV